MHRMQLFIHTSARVSCWSWEEFHFRELAIRSIAQMVVFILNKMDMKKLIKEFRHLQRERQKAKLVKNKMANFNVLLFRRRGAGQLLLDEQAEVTIRLHQGVNMVFLNRNGQGFFVLYDADIEAFDDGEPDSDENNEQPTLTATLTIYQGAQSLILWFGNLFEKRSFITALNEFLELRRGTSSDSGTSTLSN